VTGESVAYVYGVVPAKAAPSIRATGVGGGSVRAVPFDRVAALVSDVEAPIRAKRRELLSHSDVLNEAASSATVVPLQFGTTFPDQESVVDEFLEPRHDELKGLLAELDGRVEVLVKAFYVEDTILAEIVRDEPRVARLREATRDRTPAATHAARLELGTAVAAALERRTAADAAAILAAVRPFALDVNVDTTPIENQVLRASILVERKQVSAVDSALSALAERHAGRIHFKYIGPLAPHSFVALSRLGGG
jgi:Gas vesicle synthesis protein GvpL/GvpF